MKKLIYAVITICICILSAVSYLKSQSSKDVRSITQRNGIIYTDTDDSVGANGIFIRVPPYILREKSKNMEVIIQKINLFLAEHEAKGE